MVANELQLTLLQYSTTPIRQRDQDSEMSTTRCVIPQINNRAGLVRLDNSIYYQRVKNITGVGTEDPAQMGQAHAAVTNSPAVANEPAELIRSRSGISAAENIVKTADLENNPVGVGKCVLV